MRSPTALPSARCAVWGRSLALGLSFLLASASVSAQQVAPEAPPAETVVPAVQLTSDAPPAAAGDPVQLELARMRSELAALTKALTSWQEAEQLKRRREGIIEARRDEQRRLRVGPPTGFLVGGGLLLVAGAQLFAFDPDNFMPIATPLIVIGGLLVVTGIVTLTRVLRKRRVIEREIQTELWRPLPSASAGPKRTPLH